MRGRIKTVECQSLFLFCVVLCSGSSIVVSNSSHGFVTKNVIDDNNTIARVRLRFIAANVLEMQWVSDTMMEKDHLNLHSITKLDVEMEDYGNNSLLIALLVDGSCNMSAILNQCYLKKSESCAFWNLKPSCSYTVCVRSWVPSVLPVNNTTVSSLDQWKSVRVRTQFRQPPTISRCWAKIENGDLKEFEDTDRVMEIPYLMKDEITISCVVGGYPAPEIFWCEDVFDCNTSSMNTTHIVDAEGVSMAVTIKNAARHHERLLYCVAENQYGRSMTAAIHLSFMEIVEFPAGDSIKKSTVTHGDSAQLECTYPKHNLKLKFSWSKMKSPNDPKPEPVYNNDRVILGQDGSLLFVYTLVEDSGFYQCNVQNLMLETKTVSGSVSELEVKDINAALFNRLPMALTWPPEMLSALVGETLALQCVFAGIPIPEVFWQWHSKHESSHYELSDNNTTLIIHNVQLLHEQKFGCWAKNSEGKSGDFFTQVVVNEAPRFIRKPVSRNITLHQTTKFYCQADGNPQPRVQWLLNGKIIKHIDNTEPLNYTLSKNLDVLTVHEVTRLTAFNIQCNISNIYGYRLSNAYLNVFLPTKITKPPDDVILSGQSAVIFSCGIETDASTAVTITWLRGNKEIIYDDQRIFLLPNQSLFLNLTNEEDGGNSFVAQYTCIASNGMNTDSRGAKLRPKVIKSIAEAVNRVILPDMLWLGVVCGVICLIIISTTTVCVINNCHQHFTDGTTGSKDPKSGSFKMARRSKPNPGGRIVMAEKHICFDFHSIENAQVHSALEQMYIPRERLRLGNCIGRGQFGRVFSAYLCHARDKIEEHVAVKTMKYKPEETEMAELFMREALLMKDFWHAHVLGVIGVTFDPDGSPMVILPYMANGDLRKYVMSTELDITVMQLLKMSLQVAYGMTYLSSMRFVHRDLAARNCMVDERGVVKVADFGLSRELILCDYYRLSNSKTPVPVRWMAPECLEANVFTTMSDVWSFGVLLWELVTRGAVPFSDLENWEVAGYIQSGKRLLQPLYCPDSVYFIMLNCWQEDSHNRPTFEQITHDIEQIIRSAQALSAKDTSPVATPTSVYSNTQLLNHVIDYH